MNYIKEMIKPLLNDEDDFLRVKLTSGNNETKWLNIPKKHIKTLYDNLEGED